MDLKLVSSKVKKVAMRYSYSSNDVPDEHLKVLEFMTIKNAEKLNISDNKGIKEEKLAIFITVNLNSGMGAVTNGVGVLDSIRNEKNLLRRILERC